ncbi:MAG: hypothetical protein JNJ82_06185 [Opitutaceae bacterium]|nr:hypothetical protein [Opitutaceae bacterium]
MGKFLSLVLFLCGIVLVLFGVNRRPDPTPSASTSASTRVVPSARLPPIGWLLAGAMGVTLGLVGLTRNPNPV